MGINNHASRDFHIHSEGSTPSASLHQHCWQCCLHLALLVLLVVVDRGGILELELPLQPYDKGDPAVRGKGAGQCCPHSGESRGRGAGRWENGLMGWASSADYMQGTHVKFSTKEDAVRFAEKQGWSWFLQEPHMPKFTPKSYSNNFLYSPKKLRYIRTK